MRFIALLLAGFVLSGCKSIAEVGEAGSFDSFPGSSDCVEFSACEIEITAAYLDETFRRQPEICSGGI